MLWNSYRYRVEDDSIVIEDYCGEELDVSIPAEIEGLPVKKIAPEAFSTHGAMIERVEVPGSVTDIGDGAFKMCMLPTCSSKASLIYKNAAFASRISFIRSSFAS